MAQEDRKILLQDLCARLPYGVKIKLGDYDYQVCGYNSEKPLPLKIWYYYRNSSKLLIDVYLEDYHPYLRPMSSMTEEEENEWNGLIIDPLFEAVGKQHTRIEDLMLRAKSQYNPTDWLNAHHFDYRGMIEKGLAVEAPEGMYNITK